MCGRILLVEETGYAQHTVSVGASRIAAEGLGDQLERLFLPLEVEAGDSPERLVFARRSRDDRGRRGNQIGRPQRSEPGVAVVINIYIDVADGCDALLGAFAAACDRSGLAET